MIQTVIVAGLAGTRLVRAWMYEQIGEPVREPLEEWLAKPVFVDDTDIVDGSRTNAKAWGLDLVTCPHCVGVYFTIGCVLALRFGVTRPLVLGLAGATIVSAFADHYPGFKPEEGDEG